MVPGQISGWWHAEGGWFFPNCLFSFSPAAGRVSLIICGLGLSAGTLLE